MQVYKAPLRDMRFALHELFADDGYGNLAAFDEFTPDLLDAVLEEAAKMAQDLLLPLNISGDVEGCQFDNGVVRTPAGFKHAYEQFCQGGWAALANDPQWGGQGLPETLNKLVEEMLCSANLSFSAYPGLTHGATLALETHGSDELKAKYLPNLISGKWGGTMCLTEPHAGSDLGILRTQAKADSDGTYRVSGTKIFISAGDQDLTENIIHLVLARLPDAPPGVKGISMFLVPKYLVDEENRIGARNGAFAMRLEHKMGMRGAATCEMRFDDARGWLVGEAHRGLFAMFTMMNQERLSVGIQGLGIIEAAYQSATAYAKERLQGRSLSGTPQPGQPAEPIIVHPDVRRMLMTMRVYAEGCRALGVWTARALDASEHSTDPEVKERATDFMALMTPIVKALFTDLGSEAASLAIQTYGGHGYIVDSGVEQFARDVRITQIYEGTNGIQALDLVGRKLPANGGRNLRPLFHAISCLLEDLSQETEPQIGSMRDSLSEAFQALRTATDEVMRAGAQDPEEAAAAASDYLRMAGLVALGFCFLKSAAIAHKRIASGTDEADFYKAKIISARFFNDRILPQVFANLRAIKGGKQSTMALDAAAF
ncbi:acyl-CoA dehydrogenase C-terminal domain-containing protein [Croceicoccus sp. F390]|uniref:Acyl-CoA dehydrogenase C-terminal domain-containing protein n=1 Tax=Croceicoccus esteveae TaxID=3075597 RepID=A0ABU2ZEE1_9SPHN|nr:acyl-CoA dehydrogenase C-terminal domain-containing protein [Croceicoccus sp. F390]MDT0574975.1 acyl-CoA dehydrogenase C-terminal domain-containing protein [Croceicoccus sp. F390]